MKEFIEGLVEEQIDLYVRSPDRMVSDFNAEKQHVRDYNGRQILELIQNADDQGSNIVLLKLDTANQVLTICNSGTPFNMKGYKSLMLSNLSSKTKESYIGNKGLGFRSIINWSEEIRVRSNKLDVVFSPNVVKEYFFNKIDEAQRTLVLNDNRLQIDAVPWAILATPVIEVSPVTDWATEVIIRYKEEYLEDIEKQMKDLHPEVLLFLNNILEIRFEIDDEISTVSVAKSEDQYSINGEIWTIYDSGIHVLPNEYQDTDKSDKQHYNLKLALPKRPLFTKSVLYSYFPTRIILDLPFIVHGTFDLDSSRNQLNDTRKNRFVLEKLVELITSVAKTRSQERVSWEPVRILSYRSKNEVLEGLGFYKLIDTARKEQALYPCVDEEYRSLNDVIYKTANFSELVIKAGVTELFPKLLKAVPEDLQHLEYYFSKNIENIVKLVNELSNRILDKPIELRVDLIRELLRWGGGENFAVLVNEKMEIINSDDVFTPKRQNIEKLILPDHVKIEFMNNKLYQLLASEWAASSDQKERDVQRKLKEITKIQSYEPAELLLKIVSSTRAAIRENKNLDKELTTAMVTSLFSIFLEIGDKTPFPETARPQLFNLNNELVNANDLHFSRDYLSGIKVNIAFGGVLQEGALLAKREEFFLESKDESIVDTFFVWLKVNTFVKYVEIKESIDPQYISYIWNCKESPENHRSSKTIRALMIDPAYFTEVIQKCTIEQIVYWILHDPVVSQRLARLKFDDVGYSKSNETLNSYYHRYREPPSYINFQFSTDTRFSEIWISDDVLSPIVNDVSFDYTFFKETDISRSSIENVLVQLGAKDRFENLPFERICRILRELPVRDPEGKITQKIYRLALEYYKNVDHGSIDKDIPLFAFKGNEGRYYEQNEIFYSSSIKIPAKLAREKPLLNFPKRAGGKQVPAFFNVKNISELEIELVDKEVNIDLSEKFSEWLEVIKPFILSYRLDGVQQNRTIEARKLLSVSITLCSSLSCISDGLAYELEHGDYLYSNKIYYVKVNSFTHLPALCKDSIFADSFSEIICSVFDVNEHKNHYRDIFRNDLKDTKHVMVSELGFNALEDARYLLGGSDYLTTFWTSVLSIKKLDGVEVKGSDLSNVYDALKVEASEFESLDYSEFETGKFTTIPSALSKLSVNISEYNYASNHKVDLFSQHKNYFESLFYSYRDQFEVQLHEKLLNLDRSEKERFQSTLDSYEHFEFWTDSESEKFRFQYSCDYKDKFFNYILEKYRLNLKINVDTKGLSGITDEYNKKIKSLGVPETDIPISLRSLLYFAEGLELVGSELISLKQKNTAEADESTEGEIFEIPDGSLTTKPGKGFPGGNRRSKGGRHSPGQSEKKSESGAKAEIVVFTSLVKKYGESFVKHVSKQDDTVGYDIRYSPDEGFSWKYVEVKRFTNNYFHFPSSEMACYKSHRENYEIFLVDIDNKIQVLRNFDIEDASQFNLQISEYKVFFEIT